MFSSSPIPPRPVSCAGSINCARRSALRRTTRGQRAVLLDEESVREVACPHASPKRPGGTSDISRGETSVKPPEPNQKAATPRQGCQRCVPGFSHASHVFGAKGAFHTSLGHRPRKFLPKDASAESAPHADESRLQRYHVSNAESWGVAPGWYEEAPLALNR